MRRTGVDLLREQKSSGPASEHAAGAQAPEAADAVRAARERLEGDPSLVLVFPSGLDATAAARQAQDAAGCPTAGVTGIGSYGRDGAAEPGCAALALDHSWDVSVGASRRAGRDPEGAARRATAEALAGLADTSQNAVVLIFCDSHAGDQTLVSAGAYAAAGAAIPLAGGGTGGEQATEATLVEGGALRDCTVAVAIGGDRAIGVGIGHGCERFGVPAIATRTEGNRILELDGEPAVGVYLRKLGLGDGSLSDEEFRALASTHPLAQPELNGDARLRHIVGRAGGALVSVTHVPESSAIDFTHQETSRVLASAGDAVRRASRDAGGSPAAALAFDCGSRRAALADALEHEVGAVRDALGPGEVPFAGVFTRGEIGRTRGAVGDRNHAIVVVAFG